MKFFEVQRARGNSAAVHVGASGPEWCQSDTNRHFGSAVAHSVRVVLTVLPLLWSG